jgi:3-isopropylmalate/(R)-2-methylmalate dehydratase small subunit
VILPAGVVADLRRQAACTAGRHHRRRSRGAVGEAPDGTAHPFQVEPFARQMLRTGQDEITLTLGHEAQIHDYETCHRVEMPWLALR